MTFRQLNWFQLRFPSDLPPEAAHAALASLSGLPFWARVVLDVEATDQGTTHRLGVTPADEQTVTAFLRAAIPSLRLTAIDPPPRGALLSNWLWQLVPRVAAIRSENTASVSAALLSSLFPLEQGERVTLRWNLRAGPRPNLPTGRYDAQDGRERFVRAKLTLPGLMAHGELFVSAETPERRKQLVQRTAAALWSLSTPFGRPIAEPYWLGQCMRLLGQRGRFLSAPELAAVIGWPVSAPDLPGLELGAAKRLVPAAVLPETGRVLGTSDYGGLSRPVALSAKASTRGLYVLGPTGTGKTSLLKNLIHDDLKAGHGLAVIETNGDLIQELLDSIPRSRLDDVVLIDPTDSDYAVGFNPFVGSAEPSLIADQLSELFQRLWADFWGPRTAQLTHMGLLTLTQQKRATLLDIPRLYLDPGFRARVLAGLDDPIGLGPDWQWFEGLPEREQLSVVAPLLNKVRAFTARPAIRAIVGQFAPKLSLEEIIEGQKVLLVHIPKGLVGAETSQLLGCLVLTAIWQALAQRASLPPGQRQPFSLYVDEVQDFASAPVPWDELLAQGRKYGLALSIAHQNLTQLPRDLREVILANARSKAVFALGPADAHIMAQSFAPALTADDLQALDPYSVAALVALDAGGEARPVTLNTPSPLSSLGTAERVKSASRANYARPRTVVEASLRAQAEKSTAPVGRKPRRRS
jgi:hypothetical protein